MLSAGETIRQAVRQGVDLHELEELVGAHFNLVLGQVPVFQAEFHILPHRIVGEDSVVLKHHADVALGGIEIVDALVPKVKVTALDAVEAGDHTKQCGLSTTAGAEKGEELAWPDINTQVRDNDVVTVFFQRVADSNIYTHPHSLLLVILFMFQQCRYFTPKSDERQS